MLLVEEAGGKATMPSGEYYMFKLSNTLVEGIVAATARDYDKVVSINR